MELSFPQTRIFLFFSNFDVKTIIRHHAQRMCIVHNALYPTLQQYKNWTNRVKEISFKAKIFCWMKFRFRFKWRSIMEVECNPKLLHKLTLLSEVLFVIKQAVYFFASQRVRKKQEGNLLAQVTFFYPSHIQILRRKALIIFESFLQ